MSMDRLIKAIVEKQNPTVAGLDPKLSYIPEYIRQEAFAKYGKNLDGAAAAILAQTQYGVDDGEILSAIRCHTTGRPGMTKLDKIIYLADMASYERTYPEAEQLRRHALADLDRTAIEGLGLSIAWLKAGGKPVDEESLLAYADLRARYYGGRTSEQTAGEP